MIFKRREAFAAGKGFSAGWVGALPVWCCAVWLAAWPAAAVAQGVSPQELERQGDVIQRQQQERLRELLDRARPVDPGVQGADLRGRSPDGTQAAEGGPCWPIDEVVVAGGERLQADTLRGLQLAHTGRCLSGADIQRVLGRVTQDFFERGEITTRAYLPEQDLASRRLLIEVVTGRIAGYRLEGDGAQRIWLPGAFPAVGSVLNLRDLEQGVEVVNRLGSQRASTDIEPGQAPGESVVVVRSVGRLPLSAQLSFDNHGSASTGKEAASLNLVADAILGFNERWVLSRRQSWPNGRGDHSSSSTGLDLWLPWGRQSFGVNVGESEYVNVLRLASGTPVHTDGRTSTVGLMTERVIHRDQSSRVNWLARLNRQDSVNRLAGETLNSSSRVLTFGEFGLGGSTVWAQGLLTGQVSHVQGLKLAGAERDPQGLPDEAPRAQSRKLVLDLSYVRDVVVAGVLLNWTSQVNAQRAWTTLHGSQQILIGSLGSVRGFSRQSLSGDHGVFWRNELAWPMQFEWGLTPLSVRWYAGLDMGRVESRAQGAPSGDLGGVTLGASIQAGRAWLDVFGSQGVWRPTSMQREPAQVWARLSFSF